MSSLELEYVEFFEERQSARSPSEIRAAALKVLLSAIDGAVFAVGEVSGRVLPYDALKGAKPYKGLDGALNANDLKQVITAFLLKNGSFSRSKYWVALKKGGFVAFPLLVVTGNHGAAQWALSREISALLKAGRSSNMLDFCARTGHNINDEHKVLVFAKGYTLASSKERALAIKEDLQTIISAMIKNKGVNPPKANMTFKFLQTSIA